MKAPGSRTWLVALAALLVVGAGFMGWYVAGVTAEVDAGRQPERPPAVRPPPVRLATLDGAEVGLEEFSGQVVVVDFWASWCGPCVLQAKILEGLHEKLGGEVQFLAINLGEDRETIERYIADHSFAYPVLMDAEEQLGLGLEIYLLPTVMVLDRSGRISYLRRGISDRATLTAALAEAGAGIDELAT